MLFNFFPPEPPKHQYLLTGPIPQRSDLSHLHPFDVVTRDTSTRRAQSPLPKRTPLYSSYWRVPNLNFFSTQQFLPGTLPNFSSQSLKKTHDWSCDFLSAYGGGKESLWSKTIRPGFVSTVRPDLPLGNVHYRDSIYCNT
jgi:hypothetical protein